MMKDIFLHGLSDSQALIRNYYIVSRDEAINRSEAKAVLASLSWRDLDWLCGVLFDSMGFEVTPRSNDDGIDVQIVN